MGFKKSTRLPRNRMVPTPELAGPSCAQLPQHTDPGSGETDSTPYHTPSPSMALVRWHSPSIQIPHFYNPPHRPWVMHIQLQQPGWQDSSLSQFRTLKTSFWWLLRLEQSEDSSGSFYKKFTNLKTNNLN